MIAKDCYSHISSWLYNFFQSFYQRFLFLSYIYSVVLKRMFPAFLFASAGFPSIFFFFCQGYLFIKNTSEVSPKIFRWIHSAILSRISQRLSIEIFLKALLEKLYQQFLLIFFKRILLEFIQNFHQVYYTRNFP